MTTADYLNQLEIDRQDLVDNLEEKGITGLSGDETFTELVPEVLNIPSGGGKYAPRKITFTLYTGTELNYELDNLDTSNIMSYRAMFSTCQRLLNVDLTKVPVNNVNDKDFAQFFYNCNALTTINGIKDYLKDGVINLQAFFSGCSSLSGKLDVSEWVTINATTTNTTFYNCSGLTEIDMSGWDTPNLANTGNMFAGCTSLTKIDMRNLDLSQVANSNFASMFGNSATNNRIPTNCLIIVKDNTTKTRINQNVSWLTNVKTVAEL